MPSPAQRLPGPVVPGFTRVITALSPVRLPFDSLKYIVDNAAIYGPLYGIYFGDTVTYVVSDPKLAHEILVERHAEFHKAQMLRNAIGELIGNGLLTSEGDFWRRQRKLAQPAFHFGRIAAYGETMVRQTLDHITDWESGETRDIAQDMLAITLGIVNKTLFGIDVRDQAKRIGALTYVILEAANDRLNSYAPVWEKLFKTRRRREEAALGALFAIVDGIIAEHRKHADSGDLLSMLLDARDEDGNPMSAQQLRDEVMTLFVAGHETTANALDWAFYLLAQNPESEETLMTEIAALGGRPPTMADLARLPYSEWVMKEAIRLYPPAAGATREPLHDISLGGYRLPKGSNIAISTYTMHRNAAFFPDPLRFDPERFSPAREADIPKHAYLPFGAGPRVCIGNTFAMMEAQVILAMVMRDWDVALDSAHKVEPDPMVTLRPKHGIHVSLRPAPSPSSERLAPRTPNELLAVPS